MSNNNNLWSDDEDQVDTANMSTQDIAIYMAQQERSIMDMTNKLAINLKQLDEIVVAVHKVSDLTPKLISNEQKAFWQDMITPALMDTLHQDINVQVIIENSFAAIRKLTLVVRRYCTHVKLSEGNELAMLIPRTDLFEAMENLENAILKAGSLKINAIDMLSKYIPNIYEIMGPDEFNYMPDKCKYNEELNHYILRQQDYVTKLTNLKGLETSDDRTEQCGILIDLLKLEQNQIEVLKVKIKELEKREQNASDKFGLMGNPLIHCLTNIRVYANLMHNGVSVFAPLVAILTAVKDMLKDDICLLQSKERKDIFLAAQLMIRKVQFLTKYNKDAYNVIQLPRDKDIL